MGDMSMPTDHPIVPSAVFDELKMLRLARELAMELRELKDILDLHGLTREEFETIKHHHRFIAILSAELQAWQSAVNVHERVKIKAGAVVEEWLPELYARLNDSSEPLMAKVKAGELLAKLAGMGLNDAKLEAGLTDRVSITINLGADNKLEFNKALPPKVIDNMPAENAD